MHTCNITVIINRFLNLDSAPGNRASPIARRKTAGTRDTLNSDPAPGNRMFLTARRKTAGSKSPRLTAYWPSPLDPESGTFIWPPCREP